MSDAQDLMTCENVKNVCSDHQGPCSADLQGCTQGISNAYFFETRPIGEVGLTIGKLFSGKRGKCQTNTM